MKFRDMPRPLLLRNRDRISETARTLEDQWRARLREMTEREVARLPAAPANLRQALLELDAIDLEIDRRRARQVLHG